MALGLLNLLTAYRNYVDTSGWEKQSTVAWLIGDYGDYRYTNLQSNSKNSNGNQVIVVALKDLFTHHVVLNLYDILYSVEHKGRCF